MAHLSNIHPRDRRQHWTRDPALVQPLTVARNIDFSVIDFLSADSYRIKLQTFTGDRLPKIVLASYRLKSTSYLHKIAFCVKLNLVQAQPPEMVGGASKHRMGFGIHIPLPYETQLGTGCTRGIKGNYMDTLCTQ